MLKRLVAGIFAAAVVAVAHEGEMPHGFISAFKLEKNDLEITRPAQPLQYFDKIGKRAGVMGYESGAFEMWVWPWKLLRNFELLFLLGTSTQPILGRDIVRTVSVTPEATVLTYTYESFRVREIVVVPREEPGVILLLDVYTTAPLTIVCSFLPVMQPMWPAGVGGQFSRWAEDVKGFVISEGQWRAIALCGSPAGKQMTAPPAHMFADNPLQFKIEVNPGETEGRFIPIVIAGGSNVKLDSVKVSYDKLWRNAESFYRENYEYYQNLRRTTVQIITPTPEFNIGFEWGNVALDNLMVHNPTLGYGMVAGFGLSGGGARPGFAWFFGGDAFINSLAFNSFGAHHTVRDALTFTQKWQRQENFPIRKKKPDEVNTDVGKMAHELSQSDGLCDWWNDYHYGYNHADTTPWYLVAMGDYVRTSGDVEFLKQSWKSLKQAYDWCVRKDSDGDGLLDLKGAGLGALEFGKLAGIYSDVYTCAVWLQGIKEMIMMADLVGDQKMRKRAEDQLKKALPVFEKKFWIEDLGFYSYGATEKGECVREKTPWPGVGMMFELFDRKRSEQSLQVFNSADLCTDWGVRSLARSSSLFEPTNYNYGAVWPFISTFFNTAQFKHRHSMAGFSILRGVVRHAFDNAAGLMPEVFSGEMNQKLGEAYHHQGFSTTGYILPLVRGLIGLEVDALTNTVTLAPRVPADWNKVSIKNVPVGKSRYDFTLNQNDTVYSVSVRSEGKTACTVKFSPELPPWVRVVRVMLNDKEVQVDDKTSYPQTSTGLRDGDVLTFHYEPSAALLPPQVDAHPGMTNYSLKIISLQPDQSSEKSFRLKVEGLGGETYKLGVMRPQYIQSVRGAELEGDKLIIPLASTVRREFVAKEIFITIK